MTVKINTCRTQCSTYTTAKYTFFSSAHRIFNKTGPVNYGNDASEAQHCLDNHIHSHGFYSSAAHLLPDLHVLRSPSLSSLVYDRLLAGSSVSLSLPFSPLPTLLFLAHHV